MTLPPSPQQHPILQLVQWLRNPLTLMDAAARQCGDIFTMRWGGLKTAVILSAPDALQTLFKHPNIAAPGHANEIARPLLGDNSLILLDTPQHKQRRKLLMPSFHGERLANYGQLMAEITCDVMAELPGQFLVRNAMQEISLRVILKAVFGVTDAQRLQDLKRKLVDRLDMTSSGFKSTLIFLPFLRKDWGAWSPWGQVMQKQRECDEAIYREIAQLRQHPDPERIDILSMLMAARDEEGEALSDLELRDELMTLLFAGHETTATALTWALYWIHKYSNVKQQLLEELAALGPKPGVTDIANLPYLAAVCNETLRIYPVGMLTFTRVAQTPVDIGGYRVDAGTELIGSVYLAHRRQEVYPEPETFNPQRFIDRQYSPYEFIPFGGGARYCIGRAMAMLEMKLVLTTILQGWQLTLDRDLDLKPVRRGALLAPEADFSMQITQRLASCDPDLQVQTPV